MNDSDYTARVQIKRQQVIVGALIVLGLTFLVIGVLYQKDPPKYYAHSLRTWQEADSVAGYPIEVNEIDKGDGENEPEFRTAEFQPNLSTMTPLERFRLPTAQGFINFLDENARAAATGLVLYAGNPDGYPGEAVLLGHRLPDQSIVQTFYTGLTSTRAIVGQHVARGALLGTGGSLAEVREGSGIDIAHETIAGHVLNDHEAPAPPNRLDLDSFFAKYGFSGDPGPDPLALIQEEQFRRAREGLKIETP